MKISKKVSYDYVGDQIVITKIRKDGRIDISKVFIVEGVAKDIFELIKQEKDKSEIVKEISKQYNVQFETVTNDVEMFLNQLKSRGIIDE